MCTETLDIDEEATAHDIDYFFALTTVRLTTEMGNEKKSIFYIYKWDVWGCS